MVDCRHSTALGGSRAPACLHPAAALSRRPADSPWFPCPQQGPGVRPPECSTVPSDEWDLEEIGARGSRTLHCDTACRQRGQPGRTVFILGARLRRVLPLILLTAQHQLPPPPSCRRVPHWDLRRQPAVRLRGPRWSCQVRRRAAAAALCHLPCLGIHYCCCHTAAALSCALVQWRVRALHAGPHQHNRVHFVGLPRAERQGTWAVGWCQPSAHAS